MDDIVVAVQYVPVIDGVKVVVLEPDMTVIPVDAFERQSVPEIAFAVITWPGVSVKPETVQAVPEAVVVPMFVLPAYSSIVAPDTEVPLIDVVLIVSGVVVIIGSAV